MGLGHACRRGGGSLHGGTLHEQRLDHGGGEPAEGGADHFWPDVTEHPAAPGEVEGERVGPSPLSGPAEDVTTQVRGGADVVHGDRRRADDRQRSVVIRSVHASSSGFVGWRDAAHPGKASHHSFHHPGQVRDDAVEVPETLVERAHAAQPFLQPSQR